MNNFGVGFPASTQPTGDCDRTGPITVDTFPLLDSLLSANLLSAGFAEDSQTAIIPDSTVGHGGVTENGSFNPRIVIQQKDASFTQIDTSQVSSVQKWFTEAGIGQNCSRQIGLKQTGFNQVSIAQVSSTQIGSIQTSFTQVGSAQIGSTQVGIVQDTTTQNRSTQVCSTQVNSTEIDSIKVDFSQVNSSKVSLSSIQSTDKLSNIHNSPPSIYDINNSAQTLWSSLLSPTTPLNITLQIQDLPTGQLAEAQITSFDPSGRPNGGTLLIDHNANGRGWYIDPTPFDNSEFSQPLTDTAFRATTNSPAAGRYDLLTTLLHEMGHLAGFISGYNGYDNHIQTLNNSPLFVGDNFSATLTPDKSHLDPKLYPYDLMNPTLTPGVRKLPSLIDLQILNAVRHSTATDSHIAALSAPLTSTPLIGILNGNFDTTLDGWTTRGITTILNEQATLSEDERFLSNLSQTFQIPEGAKYLQFTLKDTTLGTNLSAPPDAFEVALLDTRTKLSLVDTATGLTQTDSFLNLQHDGQAYFGSGVTLPSPSLPVVLYNRVAVVGFLCRSTQPTGDRDRTNLYGYSHNLKLKTHHS